MIDNKRRDFLRQSSALLASGALTACGGSTGDGGSITDASITSSGDLTTLAGGTTTGTTAPPIGTPVPNARYTLFAATAQSAAPYTLGYAFRRGDVPAGSSVAADKGIFQVIPKNTWPDGSLKFAVLSGLADVAAGTGSTINLLLARPSTSTATLTTAKLKATKAVAQIGCGAFGTVTWQNLDWDSPFQTWIAGPAMSSWIYRKPVGSDPHLVAWLEVRLWANGAVEVLPWIENGYLRVAAPTNKSATYTFTLGGTLRSSALIDLKHHQRTPLVTGTALSYWLGADPAIRPNHDKAYLQSSELVPSYQSQVANDAIVLTGLVTSFTPLQPGNFNYDGDSMAGPGYQDPIGLLPQHDVLYLVSESDRAYAAVVRNGYSAGRWATHYRDETTQRPLRFSSYPTLAIPDSQGFKDTGGSTNGSYTPPTTGGNPPQWDVAHSPSVGYAAYLLTGRWYFMEEVQFATTANYLGHGDNDLLRSGSKGLVQTAVQAWQTRACAWDWRARVQALCVTPDSDTALRNEFIASVEANIEHFHGRYVARPNNPYGWILPGETYNDSLQQGAAWQQDFATAAFGYALSLNLPISAASSTKLNAFFQWKARSVVMRLGTKDGFWYVNGAPYVMVISPVAFPDYANGTGPWLANDAAVYAATYAVAPAWLSTTEGKLAADDFPGERSMWGNLMPAIAYAVRHGVPGAQAAYARVQSASNWKDLRAAFNQRPVWAVQPATGAIVTPPQPPVGPITGAPAWLNGKGVAEWVEIAGTSGAGGAAVDAFSGFAYNELTNEVLIAAAGGHLDSADNRVVSLRLTDDAPAWKLRASPSAAVAKDVAYYSDGKPSARHIYSSCHFIPQTNRLMLFGVRYSYGNAYTFTKVDGFNLDSNTWDAAGTWADLPAGHAGAVAVRSTGEVWTTALARWTPTSKAWTQPITTRTGDLVRTPIAHDTLRNQLFAMNWGDGEGFSTQQLFASRIPVTGSAQISVTFNPSAALNSLIADAPTYSAMDYDPDNDRFLFYCGQGAKAGVIYVIKPSSGNVWDVSLLQLSGAARPPATPGNGVQNRFRYVPALRGFVLLATGSANLYFLRTA
jgi:hypothetical protein